MRPLPVGAVADLDHQRNGETGSTLHHLAHELFGRLDLGLGDLKNELVVLNAPAQP